MPKNICNICGANYEYRYGRWKCPACGAYKQEELSNEEVTLLYNASQKLRMSDFDEAERDFSDIIEKFPKNPNGYWGRLLAKYGIKYEEDFDGRKIPTCYATSIESILSDNDYDKAISLADKDTKSYYEQQANYIETVRKEWIEKAKKERPYDVFLCYKDSDIPNGIERTQDSIAAQELYIHLTEQGYRVFFSRESLRGKVGEKYEPYIFNAISTAKVMIVYACQPDYVTSTWLKNEWTRYNKLMELGNKKNGSLLVVCDGFSPSSLPKLLASKQCFDATKRSFYSDLDNSLQRIVVLSKATPIKKIEDRCPICSSLISSDDEQCLTCGFNRLHEEFYSEEEYKYWQENTVNPCQSIAGKLLARIKMYRQELKLKAEQEKKLRDEIDALNKARLSKLQSLQELTQQGDSNLNVNAPIIHPHYAICKGRYASCDVYNIKSEMEGTTCKVSFLVKKTFDEKGEKGTWNPVVSWRLKDEDGVIVKSDRWIVEGMRIGDVKKRTLSFDNITPGKFSIEFIDD